MVAKLQSGPEMKAGNSGRLRPFFKVTATALLAGLMGMPLAVPNLLSAQAVAPGKSAPVAKHKPAQPKKPAEPQGEETIRIAGGTILPVVRLAKPLDTLEKLTGPQAEGGIGNCYSNEVKTSEADFFVILDPGISDRYLLLVSPVDSTKKANLQGAGTRVVHLDEFARLVRACTGKRLERVKIVTQTDTLGVGEGRTLAVDAYILAVDKDGNALASFGNGKRLVYATFFMDNDLQGNVVVVAPPLEQGTLQHASAH